jgi:hypothetical protein
MSFEETQLNVLSYISNRFQIFHQEAPQYAFKVSNCRDFRVEIFMTITKNNEQQINKVTSKSNVINNTVNNC